MQKKPAAAESVSRKESQQQDRIPLVSEGVMLLPPSEAISLLFTHSISSPVGFIYF